MTAKKKTTKKKTSKKNATPVSEEMITVQPIGMVEFDVEVQSISPLVMHANKDLGWLQDRAGNKPKEKKPVRDKKKESEAATHRDSDGDYAIPSSAFKRAVESIAGSYPGVTIKQVNGGFHVLGDYVKMRNCGKPVIREDMVRIGKWPNKTPDIRWRPEFSSWRATLRIQLYPSELSPEKLINLLNKAGAHAGLLEMRPNTGFPFGRFTVLATNAKRSKSSNGGDE